MRTRAYRRNEREKHIKRKENFLRMSKPDNRPHYYDAKDYSVMQYSRIKYLNLKYLSEGDWRPYYIVHARGQLNKGKIHCSCALCSCKTRNKGKRRRLGKNYAPSFNWSHSDRKKVESMKEQEKDFIQIGGAMVT